jgi:hypothetical protein
MLWLVFIAEIAVRAIASIISARSLRSQGRSWPALVAQS